MREILIGRHAINTEEELHITLGAPQIGPRCFTAQAGNGVHAGHNLTGLHSPTD